METLSKVNGSKTDQAALELRAEGIMWATPGQIMDRVESNREARSRQTEAEARQREAE